MNCCIKHFLQRGLAIASCFTLLFRREFIKIHNFHKRKQPENSVVCLIIHFDNCPNIIVSKSKLGQTTGEVILKDPHSTNHKIYRFTFAILYSFQKKDGITFSLRIRSVTSVFKYLLTNTTSIDNLSLIGGVTIFLLSSLCCCFDITFVIYLIFAWFIKKSYVTFVFFSLSK